MYTGIDRASDSGAGARDQEILNQHSSRQEKKSTCEVIGGKVVVGCMFDITGLAHGSLLQRATSPAWTTAADYTRLKIDSFRLRLKMSSFRQQLENHVNISNVNYLTL